MAILFELSESIIKQAALIAAKYSDRSLLSIIEECFEHGARSLYTEVQRPVPVKRPEVSLKELYSEPPTQEEMDNINSITNSVIKQAQEKAEELESAEEWSDSYSDFVINKDGLYEL